MNITTNVDLTKPEQLQPIEKLEGKVLESVEIHSDKAITFIFEGGRRFHVAQGPYTRLAASVTPPKMQSYIGWRPGPEHAWREEKFDTREEAEKFRDSLLDRGLTEDEFSVIEDLELE